MDSQSRGNLVGIDLVGSEETERKRHETEEAISKSFAITFSGQRHADVSVGPVRLDRLNEIDGVLHVVWQWSGKRLPLRSDRVGK